MAQGKDMEDELKTALENMSSRDYPLRHQAFEVINRAREQAVPGLLDVLRNGDGYQQDIAVNILWSFFRDYGVRHPDLVSTVIHAIKANRDNNPLVVMDGIGFISDLKDPTAFDILLEFLRDDDENLREGALEALALLKDERAIPHLVACLDDPYSLIQSRAVWALKNVADENPTLQKTVLDALHKVNTPNAIKLLEKWDSNQLT